MNTKNRRRVSNIFRFVTVLAVLLMSVGGAIPVEPVYAQEEIIQLYDDGNGGECSLIGNWDQDTKTCQMTMDVYVSISIGSGITLDGNGYSVIGPWQDTRAIILVGENITLRNVNTRDFGYCVFSGYQSHYLTITDSTFERCEMGLFGSNMRIAENHISAGEGRGIELQGNNNSIIRNVIANNSQGGILMYESDNNLIAENDILNTTDSPFFYGIWVLWSNDNIFENNNIHGRHSSGINVDYSANNTVRNNFITGATFGLNASRESTSNVFYGNTVQGNSYPLTVGESTNNRFYDNDFIDNGNWIWVEPGNFFQLDLPIGGNYWSTFDDRFEGCTDLNRDGLCDSPYIFNGGQDDLPWTRVDRSIDQPPTANAGGPYTANPGNSIPLNASGSADPDGDALSYEWDLDNDGAYDDATGVTTTTIFDQAGEYTIGVRVMDPLGLASTDTATVTVSQPVPLPSFEVVPYDPHSEPLNIVLGSDWEAGTTVTLCIDNPPYDGECDYTDSQTVPTEQNGFAGKQFDFEVDPSIFVIKAGQRVQLDNGLHTEEHIVTNLRLLWVNWEADTIGGMAVAGSEVGGWAILFPDDGSPRSDAFRRVTADSHGKWTAVFAHPGDTPDEQATIDLDLSIGNVVFTPGQQDANGNSTRFWMQGDPSPTIAARFHENEIHGHGWPLGASVTLTIDDPDNGVGVDYTDTQTVTLSESNPYQTFVEYRLWENNFELENGQIVTMSDRTTTKTHVVAVPRITGIISQSGSSQVEGFAAPFSEIWVDFRDATRHETADGTGHWLADFHVPGDEDFETQTIHIDAWNEGEARVQDEDGDSTSTNWGRGLLMLELESDGSPQQNVYIRHWPARQPVTLLIDDPATQQNPDYTDIRPMRRWSDGSSRLTIDWTGVFDVRPGFTITVTDGYVTKSMIVPLLAITGYDLANDTLSGIATPSTRVTVVGPCSLEDCSDPAEIQVVADGDGNWRAYFDDVQPGEGYEAQIYDMDADHTVLRDWSVPFNQPPVADAGPNQTAYFNQVIALDASASYDPEADVLTFEWDLDNDGAYDDASGITATTSFNQTGDHVIGLQVTDSGGLSDADTLTITILPWTLAGFYQPVDMNGVYNIVKGGSTVPFKFEIFAGPTELTSTSSMKSFAYVQISCDANAFTDQIETVVTGISGLRYDNAAGQFIYNWKTPANAGNCYRVTMTTMDDSSLVAYFKLK